MREGGRRGWLGIGISICILIMNSQQLNEATTTPTTAMGVIKKSRRTSSSRHLSSMKDIEFGPSAAAEDRVVSQELRDKKIHQKYMKSLERRKKLKDDAGSSGNNIAKKKLRSRLKNKHQAYLEDHRIIRKAVRLGTEYLDEPLIHPADQKMIDDMRKKEFEALEGAMVQDGLRRKKKKVSLQDLLARTKLPKVGFTEHNDTHVKKYREIFAMQHPEKMRKFRKHVELKKRILEFHLREKVVTEFRKKEEENKGGGGGGRGEGGGILERTTSRRNTTKKPPRKYNSQWRRWIHQRLRKKGKKSTNTEAEIRRIGDYFDIHSDQEYAVDIFRNDFLRKTLAAKLRKKRYMESVQRKMMTITTTSSNSSIITSNSSTNTKDGRLKEKEAEVKDEWISLNNDVAALSVDVSGVLRRGARVEVRKWRDLPLQEGLCVGKRATVISCRPGDKVKLKWDTYDDGKEDNQHGPPPPISPSGFFLFFKILTNKDIDVGSEVRALLDSNRGRFMRGDYGHVVKIDTRSSATKSTRALVYFPKTNKTATVSPVHKYLRIVSSGFVEFTQKMIRTIKSALNETILEFNIHSSNNTNNNNNNRNSLVSSSRAKDYQHHQQLTSSYPLPPPGPIAATLLPVLPEFRQTTTPSYHHKDEEEEAEEEEPKIPKIDERSDRLKLISNIDQDIEYPVRRQQIDKVLERMNRTGEMNDAVLETIRNQPESWGDFVSLEVLDVFGHRARLKGVVNNRDKQKYVVLREIEHSDHGKKQTINSRKTDDVIFPSLRKLEWSRLPYSKYWGLKMVDDVIPKLLRRIKEEEDHHFTEKTTNLTLTDIKSIVRFFEKAGPLIGRGIGTIQDLRLGDVYEFLIDLKKSYQRSFLCRCEDCNRKHYRELKLKRERSSPRELSASSLLELHTHELFNEKQLPPRKTISSSNSSDSLNNEVMKETTHNSNREELPIWMQDIGSSEHEELTLDHSLNHHLDILASRLNKTEREAENHRMMKLRARQTSDLDKHNKKPRIWKVTPYSISKAKMKNVREMGNKDIFIPDPSILTNHTLARGASEEKLHRNRTNSTSSYSTFVNAHLRLIFSTKVQSNIEPVTMNTSIPCPIPQSYREAILMLESNYNLTKLKNDLFSLRRARVNSVWDKDLFNSASMRDLELELGYRMYLERKKSESRGLFSSHMWYMQHRYQQEHAKKVLGVLARMIKERHKHHPSIASSRHPVFERLLSSNGSGWGNDAILNCLDQNFNMLKTLKGERFIGVAQKIAKWMGIEMDFKLKDEDDLWANLIRKRDLAALKAGEAYPWRSFVGVLHDYNIPVDNPKTEVPSIYINASRNELKAFISSMKRDRYDQIDNWDD